MTTPSVDSIVFAPIWAELFLFGLLSVVLLIEAFGRSRYASLSLAVSIAGLLVLGLGLAVEAQSVHPIPAMNGLMVIDPLSQFLKALAALVTAASLFYARRYLKHQSMGQGEFQLFALFALLGQFVMISGSHLLTIYLGIELLSLALYAAVALRRDDTGSTEAAMKYFVLGALASGFLLYGMSMIYGATGSLYLPEIADTLSSGGADKLVMVFGTVFVVSGLAFKLGVVPFHMWVPDVYQGAPTATTILIGAAPKFAAFAITIRLLVSGLLGVAMDWQQMLLILCVLSLIVGNVVALVQTDIKRILAYSTISHMGFMVLAIASGVVGEQTGGAIDAYASSLFYIVIYALTALGSFGILLLASREGFELESLDDLKGLAQTHPLLAWTMLIFSLSMAGIPPTAGFYAKLLVLESAVAAGYIELAIFAVLMSLVGAYFYLRFIKLMFFDPASANEAAIQPIPMSESIVLGVNGLGLLLLGLLPGPLMAFCVYAVRSSLAA